MDMMHQQDHFEYAENDEYQMIRLPYHGGCEMTVYLPKDSVVADKWSEKDYHYQLGLEADKQEWDTREVSLSMPKFEMEYGKELKNILKELGLEAIFDGCIYDRLTDEEMAPLGIQKEDIVVDFEEGDTVTVTGGAWEGTVGMIQTINMAKQSLTINVDLFGRETPVEISFAEVKKM